MCRKDSGHGRLLRFMALKYEETEEENDDKQYRHEHFINSPGEWEEDTLSYKLLTQRFKILLNIQVLNVTI